MQEVVRGGKNTGTLRQESLIRQIIFINKDEIFLNETLKRYMEIMTGVSLDAEGVKDCLEEVPDF